METILDKIVSVYYIGNYKNENSFHSKQNEFRTAKNIRIL
jgi:hypothetical protein